MIKLRWIEHYPFARVDAHQPILLGTLVLLACQPPPSSLVHTLRGGRIDYGRMATVMKVRPHAFSGLVVALTLTSPPVADRDCRVASERREAAISQVIDALRAYEKCILSGQKRGDCAGQLVELDSAHDEFADAVSEYPSGCQ